MKSLVIALGASVCVLAVLLGTSRDISMGFDEAFTVRRENLLAEWFAGLVHPPASVSRTEMFARPVLEDYWRFSRKEPDGHPPFYALLGLAGWRLTRGMLDPLTTYRFGPMVLTALTCGALYRHLAARYGRVAGLVGPALMLLMPRVFTHAHYAHYDMPMTCLWLLTQVAFVNALGQARWSIAFGVLLGLASGTKFTGWFALVPPLAWMLVYEVGPAVYRWIRTALTPTASVRKAGEPMPGTRCVLIGVPIAALVLYAIQPPWWSDPLWGLRRFLVSNLTRQQSVSLPSLYWGATYEFSLPWHNTLVLTAITTPVFTLVLGITGLVVALAKLRSDPPTLIWPLSFAVLMVVRALPQAPGHDVERLLLPSLASLAVLAGLGAQWLVQRLGRARAAVVAYALIAGAIGESLVGFAQYYPYQLSYYNFAIGGLPGATRAGFEPTYYWDTLGPEFKRWAREQAKRGGGSLELVLPFNELSLIYLRTWGELPPRLRITGVDATQRPLYVVQRSLGAWAEWDWALARLARPMFTISRRGVDLLRVYSYEDAFRAFDTSFDRMSPAERRRRLQF